MCMPPYASCGRAIDPRPLPIPSLMTTCSMSVLNPLIAARGGIGDLGLQEGPECFPEHYRTAPKYVSVASYGLNHTALAVDGLYT